jgi:hypothetical protein
VTSLVSGEITFEWDFDLDGVFERNDNCPMHANPSQANSDGDSHGDACDCSPSDGSAWSAPPGIELEIITTAEMFWQSIGPAGSTMDVTDVVRSSSATDFTSGGFCVASDNGSGMASDPASPPPGQAHYYLGINQNACPGVGRGTPGEGSDGAPRSALECAPP